MSTVDNRAVHMSFDNAQFERNLAQTMKSMDELKKSLDFSNAKKGFGELESASRGLRLSGVGSAIDGISNKFLALGTIAITTLANITNRAVDAGISLVKSISLDPILDGFREMETNMNSIQTILANTQSKGSTLDDVNKALETLNEYSDQTIYNFSQMARNIGTFTAAGVDLDTSVNAIKGIANLAAISGSNSEQASSAMYQLSQALASGTVKLMDWNSVVNAGMGGEVFKNALFETGKALGTIADVPIDESLKEWEKRGKTFRESLEEGWITADVLTTTLQAFTGDLTEEQLRALGYTQDQAKEMQKLGETGRKAATEVKTLTQLISTVKESVGSGWAKSFQIIVGDFEEAKSMFTQLSDAIGGWVGANADARNKVLQDWKDLGGRLVIIDTIKTAFKALVNVINPIKEAFREVFPPITGQTLFDLTQRLQGFVQRVEEFTREHGPDFKEIMRGIIAGVQIVIEVIREVAGVFADLFDRLRGDVSGGGILDFFVNISEKVQNLKKILVDEGGIAEFFERLVGYLKDPGALIDEIKDKFAEFFKGINFGSLDGLIDAFTRIKDVIKEFIENIFDVDISLPKGISDFFSGLRESVDENTTNSMAGGFERLGSVLSTFWDILMRVGDAVGWVFDKLGQLKDFIFDIGGRIYDFVTNIGPNLQKAFMSEEFDRLLEVLGTVAQLLGAKGLFDLGSKGLGLNLTGDLTGGTLTSLSGTFQQLSGSFYAVTQNLNALTGVFKAMETEIKADALLKIAAAIGIITASVLVLSLINPEALGKALAALAVGFGQLVGSMALLNTISSGPKGAAGVTTLAVGMVAMASAMLVLSAAMAVVAQLDWEEIGKGLVGLTGMLVLMTTAAKIMSGSTASLIAAGVGMVGLGIALTILAGAMKIFATMSWEDIGKGLIAVGAGLVLIAGAMHLMPATTILIGPGLVAVAFALNLLATSMLIFASMSWSEMGKGLVAIGGGLLIIAGAMQLMPVTSVLTGPALLAVALALNILGGALKIFASMSWEEIGKAMVTLGGALLILAGGLTLMSGTIGGAIAVGIAAASLLLLSRVLKEFAKLKWGDLFKGLGGIALALGTLGLAALALTPVIGNIFLLGIALLALGAGFALIGLGASLVAEAFQIIAAAGTAGIDVLMYAIDQLLIRLPDMVETFVTSILQLVDILLEALPGMIAKIGESIGALLQVIIDNAPKMGEAALTYLQTFIGVISDASPDIIALGLQIITDLLTGIRDNIDDITITVAEIIVEFLAALASQLPDIIEAGVEVLEQFLLGIAENIDDIAGAVGEIITRFIDEVGELYEDIAEAGADAIIEFLEGMGDNVREIADAAEDFIIDLLDAIADAAVDLANDMLDVLIALLRGLADAIETHDDEIQDAAWDLAWAIVQGLITVVGFKAIKDALWDMGASIGQKIIDGFRSFFGIDSPSKLMMEQSGYIIDGVVIGLAKNRPAVAAGRNLGVGVVQGFATGLDDHEPVENSIDDLMNTARAKLTQTLATIPESLQGIGELSPTITPVLDLTQVQATASQIGDLLANNPLATDISLRSANTVSAETLDAQQEEPTPPPAPPSEITFTQINQSPKALSVSDIYRATNNQITLAKKELEVV